MHKRFLTVLPVVAIVLTLVLATPVWAQPNLSITKDGPARVEPGEEFVYTIVVRNTGDEEATGVVVTDRLPEGVTFIESDPPICAAAPPDAQDRELVTCTVGVLAPEASRRIELTVTAPNEVGEITNRATVDSAQTEPETSNAVTTLVAPELVIRKLDEPDPVREDGLLLYTLRVTNEGDMDSGTFVVIDDLPLDEVDLVRVSSSNDFSDCDVDGDRVRCTGTLAPGESGTVDILVEAEEVGTIENTARVRAGGRQIDADTESTLVEARNNNDNDNNDNNNDNDNNSNTDTNTDTNTNTNTDTADTTTAQETTTADTLDSLAETTTADNANNSNSDNFQCELFLRVVRDEGGALRAQYRDDELIVQRFEQCLSADVLASTIPDRRLPFTGGSPLALFAASALLTAGLFAGRWVIRRR